MKNKLNMLIGCWHVVDDDTRIELDINIDKGRILVHAKDLYDKEQFKVRKINWDGRKLSFKLIVPSNGYTTFNEIRPLSKNRFIQKLTIEEIWRKVTK